MKSLFAKNIYLFCFEVTCSSQKFLKECMLRKTFFEQMKRGAATFYSRAASFLELAVVWWAD